jgi:hypothetical protein
MGNSAEESGVVYSAPPFFVESFPGHSNRSLLLLLLQMHNQEITDKFFASNLYIGLRLPKDLTVNHLRSYETLHIWLIVTNHNWVVAQGSSATTLVSV